MVVYVVTDMTMLQSAAGGVAGAGGTGAVLFATNNRTLTTQFGVGTGVASLLGAGAVHFVGGPRLARNVMLGYGAGATTTGAVNHFVGLPVGDGGGGGGGGGGGDDDEIEFDNVFNAVEDLGADNTGQTPIDDALANVVRSGNKIEFPAGTYRVADGWNIEGLERLGFVGIPDNNNDVTFITDEGNDLRFVWGGASGDVLIEGVTFNEYVDTMTSIRLNLLSDTGCFVRDVDYKGKTPVDTGSPFMVNMTTRNEDGVSKVTNLSVVSESGAESSANGGGPVCVRVAPAHAGEVVLSNCTIHERNGPGTRLDPGTGVATVKGCEFVNCGNSCIWIGSGTHSSKVSSVSSTYIMVDGSRPTADAIRVDASQQNESGLTLDTVEIEWDGDTARGVVASPDFGNHGAFEMRNCAIRNDNTGAPTVYAGTHSVDNNAVTIEDSDFIGSGDDFIAVDRPDSIIRDSCVEMPNAQIVGFQTDNLSFSGCDSPSPSATAQLF